MPEFSARAQAMPESPIRKLVRFSEAAIRRGTHVYHLNIGQPDIATPPQFMQAVAAAEPRVLAYSHSAGTDELRDEIAKFYHLLGIPIDREDVLVTVGASEALNFVFTAIMDGQDEVIVPEPFYANYLSFALGTDSRVVPVTTFLDDNFALPSVAEIESKITPRTRGILICNPNNPTGIAYPREALERLAAVVKKHDLFLISDEVYREFQYVSQPIHSILELPEIEDRAIVVDSISKRFSACGARIGCLISRNRQLQSLVLKMAQARLAPPTLGQIGAAALFRLPPSYHDKVLAEYTQRQKVVKDALGKIPGVQCSSPQGAIYVMARLPVDDTDEFCRWMLEKFSHEGSTVMMAPGAGFYATPGLGKNEVRIAFVLNSDELQKAMKCLEVGLAEYQKR